MITKLLIALGIGIVAGAIDIIPMLNKPIPKFSLYYVFAQWVFIGLIIPFVSWPIDGWLRGLIIATLGMVPIAIIAFSRNKKQVPMIIASAAVFGAVIGFASDRLIG